MICRVKHKTFVIMFMLQKIHWFLLIVFTFAMLLLMVAIIYDITIKNIIITANLYFVE